MRRLAVLAVLLTLASMPVVAGDLDLHVGAGPSMATLGELNTVVSRFDAIIAVLDEFFDQLDEVQGTVGPIGRAGRGLSLSAGERYWLTERFALGGEVSYFGSSEGTSGIYTSKQGAEGTQSTIDIQLRSRLLSAALETQLVFLNADLTLGAVMRLGYHYASLDVFSLFEIPAEYPDVLAGVPADIDDRFVGGAFGGELGLTVRYPLFPWLHGHAEVTYRYVPLRVTNAEGFHLDLDGNGTPEQIDLGGFTVRLGLSVRVDLSDEGRKE
ncbi:MAG: hypothetical protein JSW65_06075 [Candidatus Bipolaricaulota bacterium]|nr:MAG: hypothetical protein JSW65_06075 [Candidatus Bipolaricaulota bacterium]